MTKDQLIYARQHLEIIDLRIKHEREWAEYWHDENKPVAAISHETRVAKLEIDKYILERDLLNGGDPNFG
jgi:hypothetical protein